MSKHPIPDWLRSQFSRIEDEVQELGPCGVFTQMRTVTQTYFEQQAAAPQPPALGGEPDAYFADINDPDETGADKPDFRTVILLREHRAHLATLQAEIERLTAAQMEMAELYFLRGNEIDQLKARRDGLEALLREVAALDPRGEFMGWQLDGRIDAALSKPAGSEKVLACTILPSIKNRQSKKLTKH